MADQGPSTQSGIITRPQRLRDETNPLLLARQMGTSVEMLEKHYVQTTTAEVAAQVTKRKPSTIEVKSAKGGYPF